MVKSPWLLPSLCAVLLLGLFSPEIRDSDFWWHLKTGQYVVEHRALPAPDPFAYTTASVTDAYPGEAGVRYFNLTHEWLAQAAMFGVYSVAGFGGIVLFRALLLATFCGLAGWIAYRRSGGLYRSVAVALAASSVAVEFALDRPFLFTFLFLALTVAILEWRRFLWLLPPLFLIWANCHGGFFLGWLVVAAYACEDAWHREWRRLLVPALAILVSGINPNGFRVVETLLAYRASEMQSTLLEWAPPQLWPPQPFSVLLAAAAAVLLWARRKVRMSDWLLFAAFTAMALTAQRNIVFVGFLAPILMASYLPRKQPRPVPAFAPYAAGALLLAGLAVGLVRGNFFQLRAAEWRYPSGAADFLRTHRIGGHMYNTYEFGGYLIWRLAPQQRVFIDGRALSDSLFQDYARILYNHEGAAQPLLDRYKIDTVVMNGFEYVNGLMYLLAPMLADPSQTTWKLVYTDDQAMVFLREPPAGVPALDPRGVLDHLERECRMHIEREPQYPRCARSLAQTFAKVGDFVRARRWLGVYLEHWNQPDPEARQAYQQYLGAGN